MNRRLVLLNLALLALAAALVWALRTDWFSQQTKEQAVLSQKVEPKKILAPPSPPPVKPVSPSDYVDVAGKMLFAKDRNPTVVLEPPPAKPEPPMPALPRYYGQMAIGEPVALLSAAGAAQRGYHAGDAIGDFTLVGFDRDNIEFEWKGKSVKRKLEELRAKDEAPPEARANASAGANPAAPAVNATSSAASLGAPARIASLGGASGSSDSGKPADSSGDTVLGPALPDGSHACLPADSSPPGTVHSGFIKTVTGSIVGTLCNWEKLK